MQLTLFLNNNTLYLQETLTHCYSFTDTSTRFELVALLLLTSFNISASFHRRNIQNCIVSQQLPALRYVRPCVYAATSSWISIYQQLKCRYRSQSVFFLVAGCVLEQGNPIRRMSTKERRSCPTYVNVVVVVVVVGINGLSMKRQKREKIRQRNPRS